MDPCDGGIVPQNIGMWPVLVGLATRWGEGDITLSHQFSKCEPLENTPEGRVSQCGLAKKNR